MRKITIEVPETTSPYQGSVCEHPDHGLVYVVDGSKMIAGKVSNHYFFHKVNEDGTLDEEELSGYGW